MNFTNLSHLTSEKSVDVDADKNDTANASKFMARKYSSNSFRYKLPINEVSDDEDDDDPIPIEIVRLNHYDANNSILERLGFKLGPIVGVGTYSKVRQAELINQPQHDKLAVKIINRRRASKEFVGKFLPREIKILSNIRHPNIVRVHRIIEMESDIYIFMDLAETDLLTYIQSKSKPLSSNEGQHYFRQIVSAVAYLHENDICHRDLKCENILLFPSKTVKLSDFGFAKKLTRKRDAQQQMSRTFCGSAAYAAPEILSGIPYEPQLCDVWSLGCILFILLTSNMPFDDTNLKVMLQYQLARKPKYPTDFEDKIGLDAKDLLSLMLEPVTRRRIKIHKILSHPWMTKEVPTTE